MSTSARGNTDANSMWTDTHGLLAEEAIKTRDLAFASRPCNDPARDNG